MILQNEMSRKWRGAWEQEGEDGFTGKDQKSDAYLEGRVARVAERTTGQRNMLISELRETNSSTLLGMARKHSRTSRQ